MNKPLPQHLQPIVESFCEAGCMKVNEIIEILDNGGHIDEIIELTEQERALVLSELKNIMSVYDQSDADAD